MQQDAYDITYTDLNPTFLYFCNGIRTEEETNYHCHDFLELAIFREGTADFIIDGVTHSVAAGDVLILNPGTYHRCIPTGEHPSFHEYYLAFTDVKFIDCGRNQMPLFSGRKCISRMPDSIRDQLFRLCDQIEQENKVFTTGRYFMLKSCLIQVLCLISRFQQQEKENNPETNAQQLCEFKTVNNKKYIVGKIRKYMEEHYREKISLDQIATNMYLSPFYISKLFKSETGDTPINYLISLRMGKAKELLDTSPDISVQAVAFAVGYEDAYHFSKLFKKYYGLSPMYYKARTNCNTTK